jgi:acyl-coenzyme A synthetase/AMP-(fatty) acid ligase
MTVDKVMAALRDAMDPVFLPRPLRLVAELPRNETGKLPRAQLMALLAAR